MGMTLQEFSRRCGIPAVTISRALNHYPHISVAMQERVHQAATRLGYEANLMARGLARKRSTLLAFVIPDIRVPFYSAIIDRVEREIAEDGLSLMTFHTDSDPERERRALSLVQRLRADALILAPMTLDGRLINSAPIKRLGMPVVYFDRYLDTRHSFVMLDNRMAGRLAAEHLIGQGHRRLAMIESPEDPGNVCVRDRREGFAEALRQQGCPHGPDRFWSRVGSALASDAAYGRQVLESKAGLLHRRRITGLFAYTDFIAFGALRALNEAGKRVPEHLSIVGCDDVDLAPYSCPALTTLAQPREAIARALVKAVRAGKRQVQEIIAPYLVIRESTAPASDNRAKGKPS